MKMGRKEKQPIPTGSRFGRWQTVGESFLNEKFERRYNVKCDCGNTKHVRKGTLLNGESTSCGCLASENSVERSKTHGLSKHPLYQVWDGMKKRCYREGRKDYKHYGGRGIKMCEEWLGEGGLVRFIEDMYPSFEEGLELDRINVNGNYEKENCQWVSRREQVINRRPTGTSFDTHYLTYNGETLCISQWADRVGIPPTMLSDRVSKLGWSVERALTQKAKPRDTVVCINGEDYRAKDIFKAVPNLHSLAKRLDLAAHEYLALLFKDTGKVKIYLSKQWEDVEITEELLAVDITKNKVPPLKGDFPYKDLVTV